MISISRADINEAEEILAVKIDAFREEVQLYGGGPPGYDLLEHQIESIKESDYFKIVDGKRIIGGIGVRDQGEGHYWICSIFVAMDYQNKGLGTLARSF